jgi:hypothetical protein
LIGILQICVVLDVRQDVRPGFHGVQR